MDFPDPIYRNICSQATLQSSKQGFFSEFVSTVIEKIGKSWIENVFGSQKLEEDRIRICCTDENAWKAIEQVLQNIQPFYREKSAAASQKSRIEGDKCFMENQFEKASMLYSQSIIRAPKLSVDCSIDKGLSLPLAYRCRANALYELQLYNECLGDLNLALREGMPNSGKHEIYWKMGMCHFKLKNFKKTKVSFNVAVSMIDDQILKLEKVTFQKQGEGQHIIVALKKRKEEIMKILCDLNIYSDVEETTLLNHSPGTGPLPEVTGCQNAKYENASELLTVKKTAEAGRFAVAADYIETGATLVVEEPYASCLTPKMFSSHCHHCYARLVAPVPCDLCSGLAFCSTNCRDVAMRTYHKYECRFLGLFIGAGMSVLSFLSLRMITQKNLSFFKKLHEKIQVIRLNPEIGMEINFTEEELAYMKVYNLISHSEMRTNEDYFRRALMAIFLVKCLKKTEFFDNGTTPNCETGELSEEELLTASLILRHVQILQFNAHEMYETSVAKHRKTRGSKSVYTAVGIYPTVALFNHECSPAVTRYFHGKKIIIKSVRPIKRGEIISENYGPIFTKRTLPERQRELTSRYWFRCGCEACVEDWPTIDHLSKDSFRLRCQTPNCTGLLRYPVSTEKHKKDPRCQKCFRKSNVREVAGQISKLETLFNRGIEHMDVGRCEKAIPLLEAFLDEIFKLGVPPNKEISLCQEALRTCYAQMGNLWIRDG